ncbi:MAG TPA: hypothetical protein VHJ17_17615 [Thermomonospora sp.]|nr:hypothetical protein [Thermomonospora sp.]
METIRVILFGCHFAALATLLGGLVAGPPTHPRTGRVVLGAAAAMLGTGVLLVAVRAGLDLPVNGPKMAVKTVVAAGVVGCLLWARRRPEARRRAGRFGAGGLAVANAVVAMAWT